jgi:hypothetical protein
MALAPSGSAAAGLALPPTTLSPRLRQPMPAIPARPHASLGLQHQHHGRARNADLRCRRRLLTARGERPEDDDDDEDPSAPSTGGGGGFDAAVALFNRGEFHACHDVVEELWYDAEDPARTLLHGILQCAVGFHHLFNQVIPLIVDPIHDELDLNFIRCRRRSPNYY